MKERQSNMTQSEYSKLSQKAKDRRKIHRAKHYKKFKKRYLLQAKIYYQENKERIKEKRK